MFHTRVLAEAGEAGTLSIVPDKQTRGTRAAEDERRSDRRLLLWLTTLMVAWCSATLPAQTLIYTAGIANNGPAIDSSGAVYFFLQDSRIVKATPSANGYSQETVLQYQYPAYQSNLVVDSAGALYYPQNGSIKKEVPGAGGTYTETVIPGSVTGDLAVDASGNVYGTTATGVTKFTLSGGNYTAAQVLSGLNAPTGITVDAGGNLFVVESGAKRVLKETLSGGQYSQSVIAENLYPVPSVAVDGTGNVYFADVSHVFKAAPSGSGYTNTVFGSFDAQNTASPIAVQYVAVNPQGTTLIVQGTNTVGRSSLLAYMTNPVPPPSLNFNTVALGSQAQQTLTYTFASSVTLGSYRVTTAGATGQDYTDAGGGTCTAGASYGAGASCTVSVRFRPRYAGSRAGAVTFLDSGGALIAGATLRGTGTGPQLAFAPATVNSILKNAAFNGIAVDGNGAVYLSDLVNKRVLKETPGGSGYTETVIASGLIGPYGVAVDGAGNVYVIDNDMTIGASGHYDNGVVLKLSLNGSGGYTKTTIGTGYGASRGIAADSRGNIYVSDTDGVNNFYIYRLAPLPGGGYTNTVLTESYTVGSLAVDDSGVVYVADSANGRVYRHTADANGAYSGGQVGIGTLFASGSVAVDGAGNLYVVGFGNSATLQAIRVAGIDATGVGTITYTAGTGIITVDAGGTVYGITQSSGSGSLPGVYRADQATPPTLTLDPTAVGQTSQYPVSVQLTNIGTAPLNFTVPGSGTNPVISSGFSIDVGYESDGCPSLAVGGAAASLAPGTACRDFVNATPTAPGSYTGTLTFTDDNANVAGATQVVKLNGTGTGNAPPAATLTWATPAPIASGTPLSATQLNAVANVPGTYVYTPAAGTVLSPGSHTLSVTFTPTDTGSYSSATATVTIQVTSSPTTSVTWAPPAAITYGTALGATQLNATATVPGTFVYAPAAGTVLSAGTHTLSVTFTPNDTTLQPITATVSIVVNQAAPTIRWATPATITYGTPLSAAQLNATGSVPGTLTYTPPAGTVLSVGNQTLSVTLTPTDAVDYASATATVVLQVGAGSLDFTFTNTGTTRQTVIPGSATNYAFALAPTAGTYPGDVSFTVTGLPAGATFTLSPATVSASAGAQTETLQVQTAPYSAANTRGPLSDAKTVWACMLAPLSLLALRRRRRALGPLLLPLLFAVVSLWGCMGLVGCGSGNGFFGLQPRDYTITVTASSGSIQHAATVTLNLQ